MILKPIFKSLNSIRWKVIFIFYERGRKRPMEKALGKY